MPAPTPVSRIVVRMYRIGTGDCFALKFFKGKQKQPAFRMLIDCGSCRGDDAHFEPFLQDLADWLGRRLDLLVVTHEHLDHVNGFAKGADLFGDYEVAHVWMAWTEDPNDDDAARVQSELGMQHQAVALGLARLAGWENDPSHVWPEGELEARDVADAGRRHMVDGIRELLSLYESPLDQPLAAGPSELSKAMTFLKGTLVPKTGRPEPDYLHPGTLAPALPGLEGIRMFVLGPPKDVASLKVKVKAGDVYERKQALGAAQSFHAAVEALAADRERPTPFDDVFAMDKADATALTDVQFRGANAWRDVSFDWLEAAGELAMRLQTHTNNTSLALAIEFVASERVLLFPGDAEIGHWRSWHAPAMSWRVKYGTELRTVTATELLNRTVFYKVGHHSSHNGTASVSGLDLMTSEDLHAMITLDMARIGTGWEKTMPSPGLIRKLIASTRGRLFRIDQGPMTEWPPSPDWDATTSMTAAQQAAFDAAHTVTPQFIELEFAG